jgi:hypothetical protein
MKRQIVETEKRTNDIIQSFFMYCRVPWTEPKKVVMIFWGLKEALLSVGL